MANFSKDEVKKLLELVGGKENIVAVSHCVMEVCIKKGREGKSRRNRKIKIS